MSDNSLAEKSFTLEHTSEGLTLFYDNMSLRWDFSTLLKRIKPHNLNGEMLIKAAKLKNEEGSSLTALDLTAGLGEDSFLLAAYGFNVIMYEKNHIIASLLEDSLKRGKADSNSAISEVANRMTFFEGDSIEAIKKMKKNGAFIPDLVYMDPMFPERTKSGLVKKKLQLFKELEEPCDQEEEMLQAAMDLNPRKIVVKRPIKGAYLAGVKPSYSIKGSVIRYDCIIL